VSSSSEQQALEATFRSMITADAAGDRDAQGLPAYSDGFWS